MKTRNIDLDNNLQSNLFRHIILTAPTIAELEKKIKAYEMLFTKIVTDTYNIQELSMQREPYYHVTPNKSYQIGLDIHFYGPKKENTMSEEHIKKYLKELVGMETPHDKLSPNIKGYGLASWKNVESTTLIFEINDRDKMENTVADRKRQILEELIIKRNLTNAKFSTIYKVVDPKTGKINVSMLVQYEYINYMNKSNEHPTAPNNDER